MLDHLTLARHWKDVATNKGADIYVCYNEYDTNQGPYVFFFLSERYYPTNEVEWTHRMRLTEEQAREIIEAGIAQEWTSFLTNREKSVLKYAKGDLFSTADMMIVHGCNALGVMGAGVARIVADKYPEVCTAYKHYVQNYKDGGKSPLGTVHYARPHTRPLVIANAITQDRHGGPTARWVSYDAIDDCFAQIVQDIEDRRPDLRCISIPKIGTGLGGGDWDIIEKIIDKRCKDLVVTVWEL